MCIRDRGKTRHLQEGQLLRLDGYLLNPDGSIMPAFDHIAMSGPKVMVFRDGEGEALTDTLLSLIHIFLRRRAHYTR